MTEQADTSASVPNNEGGAADAALYDLDAYALIGISGADAAGFLHAQLTGDILGLAPGLSRLAAWCDAKGRMLALFRVTQWEDDSLLLRLPASLLDTTLARLKMFVLRSRVDIHDAGAQTGLCLAGISGERVAAPLMQGFGTLPETPGQVVRKGAAALIRVPGASPRFELIAQRERLRELTAVLQGVTRAADMHAWQRLEIEAGLPEVWPQTRGLFVPQMVNLQRLDGISFRKGCYPGQEVVARMHYLGKLKRRMYVARTASGEVPAPGDAVFAEGEAQAAGNVVSAVPHPDGGAQLSAVLRIESADAPLPLRVGSAAGPALELGDLPYSVEDTAVGKEA